MIFHYLNLTAWRGLAELHLSNRDMFFCDTISLYCLAKIFGFSPAFVPGPTKVGQAVAHKSRKKSLYLVSNAATAKNFKNSKTLINFKNEIFIYPELLSLIDAVKPDEIFIGISSPKQNHLAQLIYEYLPDANIYCIGAALNPISLLEINSKYSKTGLQWLEFLLRSPNRTFVKIIRTLKEIFYILFNSKSRIEFKIFCAKLVAK